MTTVNVPVEFFESVIAIEVAITGALLFLSLSTRDLGLRLVSCRSPERRRELPAGTDLEFVEHLS